MRAILDFGLFTVAVAATLCSVAPALGQYGGGGYAGPPAAGYHAIESCEVCDLPPVCEECPNWSLVPFFGYDSWRGVSDGTWQHNGLHTGGNFGTRLGPISDWTGIGMQIGGSVGVYDWNGTDYRSFGSDEPLTQGFLTYGFFRRADEMSSWSAAIVHDWMFNDNFSVFGQDPTLSQWRAQFGYAINDLHELGLWGAFRGQGDTRDIPEEGPVTWQAVNQLSAYWHYKWGRSGANTTIWLGVPEYDRLTGDGSLGDYFVGGSAHMPLNDYVAAYSLVSYMHPSAGAGTDGAKDDAWSFVLGVAFYWRGDARTETIAGQCWAPLMPVANNGYFLVDASENF